jgi:serine/threonine protein kinase
MASGGFDRLPPDLSASDLSIDVAGGLGRRHLENRSMTDVFAEPRVGGEYRLLRTIRRGPWMTYLADDDEGQQIRMTCIAGSAALHDELLQDVRRFQECSGARLVKPLKAVERQDMLVVIHPEPDAGDLAAFCAERTPKASEALAIVAQIAEAVQSLHSGDLLHGWLDPQNILVGSGSQVLVQGGGLYAAVKHYLTTRQALFHGSSMSENPFWAPELGIADTVQSDLYSLGRLCYSC